MTQEEYFKRFEAESEMENALTGSKNKDYADPNDAFANFRQIEHLTSGRISAEMGILTRMSDKFTRVANLLARPAAVADESILDTLRDISVYAKILRIYIMAKTQEQLNTGANNNRDITYHGPFPPDMILREKPKR